MQMIFSILVALIVAASIQWIGILVINALLILPAAAARNISRNTIQYIGWAIVLSLVSGICGLIGSYYFSTSTGATIVLFSVAIFIMTLLPSCRT